MGQYFCAAVLPKGYKKANFPIEISIFPSQLNCYCKIIEHSYIKNIFVDTFIRLISDDFKQFYGLRAAWIGDYTDIKKGDESYYELAKKVTIDFKMDYFKQLKKGKRYKYIINFSKKQYIVIPNRKSHNLYIHPLPFLISCSCNNGCNDYKGSNMRYLGYWAFDKIGATNNESLIKDLKELKVTFETFFNNLNLQR